MGMFEYNFGDAEIAFLLFFVVTIPYISAQESASEKNSSRDEKLRIAILGTRGIPANYGGFETFAEELSKRLVSRGHSVIVYCRSHYVDKDLKLCNGVRLIHHPAIRHKYLDTISHTFITSFDVLFRKVDVVLICNAANAFLSWIPKISGKEVVINVDGIERLRKKWNWLGRLFYLLNERLATLFPDRIVTDARTIKTYYLERYNCDSSFIPYGSSPEVKETKEILNQLEILKNKYLLYVSRLEPENNAHLVIEAYLQTRLQVPLVLVGDAPYSEKYISDLKALASQGNVLMPGAIYGDLYRELISHCLCYLHATEVGGTHPALIEAMGVGAIVVANETEENREVLGEAGILCQFDDTNKLAEVLKRIGQHPENFSDLSAMAAARARQHYNWDQVTNQYEDLFYELVK
jgi:glycosyltransferase involved in cell wall biosynthesis